MGERTRYLGSDAIIKTILLMGTFGAMTGLLLAMKRVSEAARPDRRIGVEFTLINDTDIEDAETRKLFAAYVEEWPNVTGFMAELGIEPRVVVRFEREQDEPLLLLPDYLAGAFYHADERANLSKPVAAPDEVRAIIEPFCRRQGRLLVVQDGDFKDAYPLEFEGGFVERGDDIRRGSDPPHISAVRCGGFRLHLENNTTSGADDQGRGGSGPSRGAATRRAR